MKKSALAWSLALVFGILSPVVSLAYDPTGSCEDYACAVSEWEQSVAAYSEALAQDPKDLDTARTLVKFWNEKTSVQIGNPYHSVVADRLDSANYNSVAEFFTAVDSGLDEIAQAEDMRAEWLSDVNAYGILQDQLMGAKAAADKARAEGRIDLLPSIEAAFRSYAQQIVELAGPWMDRIAEDPEAFNAYAHPHTAASIGKHWQTAWVKILKDFYDSNFDALDEETKGEVIDAWVDPYLREPTNYPHFRDMVNNVWGDPLFSDKLTHYTDHRTTPWEGNPDWQPGDSDPGDCPEEGCEETPPQDGPPPGGYDEEVSLECIEGNCDSNQTLEGGFTIGQ